MGIECISGLRLCLHYHPQQETGTRTANPIILTILISRDSFWDRYCATACEWELDRFGRELCVRSVEIVRCQKAPF